MEGCLGVHVGVIFHTSANILYTVYSCWGGHIMEPGVVVYNLSTQEV